MFISASKSAAIVFLAGALCFPQISAAEPFTSSEFLAWSYENQTAFFHTAIGMAGLIARQNDSRQGDCIDQWYFENQDGAARHILSVMRTYPTYHPQGVILAVLEKECGELRYGKS